MSEGGCACASLHAHVGSGDSPSCCAPGDAMSLCTSRSDDRRSGKVGSSRDAGADEDEAEDKEEVEDEEDAVEEAAVAAASISARGLAGGEGDACADPACAA